MISEKVKEFIKALDFKDQSGIWSKEYGNSVRIEVNFSDAKICYDSKIELGDGTTSNFESSENFVVLECVDRLLTKGYPADKIVLEHKWSLGKQFKGKLDILIKDKDKDKPYLMIECKTWGGEYDKEKKRMLKDGGQLFSYFQQDKTARWLCLYTSTLQNGTIKCDNGIIKINNELSSLDSVKETYARWNKQFNSKGIFEEDVVPYHIETKPLIKKDLKELTEGDSSIIYNHFLEILRHNVVSDKPNAFNKIFNLFLCKILDEEKSTDNDELKFQWIDNRDDYESLSERLNDLYKEGMKKYLEKEITDYSKEQIQDKTQNAGNKEEILNIFKELRL